MYRPPITVDNVCWPTVVTTINDRIAVLHLDLESAPLDRVPGLQGEVRALRLILQQGAQPGPIPLTPLDA